MKTRGSVCGSKMDSILLRGVGFNKCYEPAIYGVRGKPHLTKGIENLSEIQNKELSSGNRLIEEVLDQLDVWLIRRLAGIDYQHATSKPPNLHEKAIRRCTKIGDIILDFNGGVGQHNGRMRAIKTSGLHVRIRINILRFNSKKI